MMYLCPNCNNRFAANDYDTDFEHQCDSGVAALDQEDVLKTDSWVDESTGQVVQNPNSNFQGIPNKLAGTEGAIEGAKDVDRNVRGKPTSLYRTRQHYEYIELK